MDGYLQNVLSGRLPVNHQIIYRLQDIFNLLPNVDVEELVKAFAVKTNDMMLAIYLSSVIRAIVALHNLVDNRLVNKEKAGITPTPTPRSRPRPRPLPRLRLRLTLILSPSPSPCRSVRRRRRRMRRRRPKRRKARTARTARTVRTVRTVRRTQRAARRTASERVLVAANHLQDACDACGSCKRLIFACESIAQWSRVKLVMVCVMRVSCRAARVQLSIWLWSARPSRRRVSPTGGHESRSLLCAR